MLSLLLREKVGKTSKNSLTAMENYTIIFKAMDIFI